MSIIDDYSLRSKIAASLSNNSFKKNGDEERQDITVDGNNKADEINNFTKIKQILSDYQNGNISIEEALKRLAEPPLNLEPKCETKGNVSVYEFEYSGKKFKLQYVKVENKGADDKVNDETEEGVGVKATAKSTAKAVEKNNKKLIKQIVAAYTNGEITIKEALKRLAAPPLNLEPKCKKKGNVRIYKFEYNGKKFKLQYVKADKSAVNNDPEVSTENTNTSNENNDNNGGSNPLLSPVVGGGNINNQLGTGEIEGNENNPGINGEVVTGDDNNDDDDDNNNNNNNNNNNFNGAPVIGGGNLNINNPFGPNNILGDDPLITNEIEINDDPVPVVTTEQWTLRELKDVLDDATIELYFDKFGSKYKIKDEYLEKFTNLDDVVNFKRKIEVFQNQIVLTNLMNGLNRTENSPSALLFNNVTNSLLTVNNFEEVLESVGLLSGDEMEELKQNALQRFIKDFSEGNLAYAQAKLILDSIGVKDLKMELPDGLERTYKISFSYGDKQYSVSCTESAAKQGNDYEHQNNISGTYIDTFRFSGATDEIIDEYFYISSDKDGEVTYALREGKTMLAFQIEIGYKEVYSSSEVNALNIGLDSDTFNSIVDAYFEVTEVDGKEVYVLLASSIDQIKDTITETYVSSKIGSTPSFVPSEPDPYGGYVLIDNDTLEDRKANYYYMCYMNGINITGTEFEDGTYDKDLALACGIYPTGDIFGEYMKDSEVREYLRVNFGIEVPNPENKAEFEEFINSNRALWDKLADLSAIDSSGQYTGEYNKQNVLKFFGLAMTDGVVLDYAESLTYRGTNTLTEYQIEIDAEEVENYISSRFPDLDAENLEMITEFVSVYLSAVNSKANMPEAVSTAVELLKAAEAKGVDPAEYISARLVDFVEMRIENPGMPLDEMNEQLAVDNVNRMVLNNISTVYSNVLGEEIESLDDLLELHILSLYEVDNEPELRSAYMDARQYLYMQISQGGDLTNEEFYNYLKNDLANIFPDVMNMSEEEKAELLNNISKLDLQQIKEFINKAIAIPAIDDESYQAEYDTFIAEFNDAVSNSTFKGIENPDKIMDLNAVYMEITGVEFDADGIINAFSKLNEAGNIQNAANIQRAVENIQTKVEDGELSIGDALWQMAYLSTGSTEDKDILEFIQNITGFTNVKIVNASVIFESTTGNSGGKDGKRRSAVVPQDEQAYKQVVEYYNSSFQAQTGCTSTAEADEKVASTLSDPDFWHALGNYGSAAAGTIFVGGAIGSASLLATGPVGGVGAGALWGGTLVASDITMKGSIIANMIGDTLEFFQTAKRDGCYSDENIANYALSMSKNIGMFLLTTSKFAGLITKAAWKGAVWTSSAVKSTINFSSGYFNAIKHVSSISKLSLTRLNKFAIPGTWYKKGSINPFGGSEYGVPYKDGFKFKKFDKTGKSAVEYVVDKTKDTALQKFINEVKSATEGMSDSEKVEYLYNYMIEKFGISKGSVKNANNGASMPNGNFLLGEIFTNPELLEKVVCRHRATLFKILGDEIGLKIKTVYGHWQKIGNYGAKESHLWNMVEINGTEYIYDANMGLRKISTELMDISKKAAAQVSDDAIKDIVSNSAKSITLGFLTLNNALTAPTPDTPNNNNTNPDALPETSYTDVGDAIIINGTIPAPNGNSGGNAFNGCLNGFNDNKDIDAALQQLLNQLRQQGISSSDLKWSKDNFGNIIYTVRVPNSNPASTSTTTVTTTAEYVNSFLQDGLGSSLRSGIECHYVDPKFASYTFNDLLNDIQNNVFVNADGKFDMDMFGYYIRSMGSSVCDVSKLTVNDTLTDIYGYNHLIQTEINQYESYEIYIVRPDGSVCKVTIQRGSDNSFSADVVEYNNIIAFSQDENNQSQKAKDFISSTLLAAITNTHSEYATNEDLLEAKLQSFLQSLEHRFGMENMAYGLQLAEYFIDENGCFDVDLFEAFLDEKFLVREQDGSPALKEDGTKIYDTIALKKYAEALADYRFQLQMENSGIKELLAWVNDIMSRDRGATSIMGISNLDKYWGYINLLTSAFASTEDVLNAISAINAMEYAAKRLGVSLTDYLTMNPAQIAQRQSMLVSAVDDDYYSFTQLSSGFDTENNAAIDMPAQSSILTAPSWFKYLYKNNGLDFDAENGLCLGIDLPEEESEKMEQEIEHYSIWCAQNSDKINDLPLDTVYRLYQYDMTRFLLWQLFELPLLEDTDSEMSWEDMYNLYLEKTGGILLS